LSVRSTFPLNAMMASQFSDIRHSPVVVSLAPTIFGPQCGVSSRVLRDNVYEVIGQLKHAEEVEGISNDDKKEIKATAKGLGQPVEYAPWWVRILSALCLAIGTMVGYQRIVTTLGARLGKTHMTPAQGASAETVSAVLISFSGFSGFPVSTTHIVTSGIAGTMVAAGSKLQWDVLTRILIAWLVTLPVTIFVAAGLYYLFESPTSSIAR
jgi:inorganic phosphate transporter, PiT family